MSISNAKLGNAVVLAVKNLNTSKHLYHEVLGFELVEESSNLIHLKSENKSLYLVNDQAPSPALSIIVTNPIQTMEMLLQVGFKQFIPQNPSSELYVIDPDGHLFVLAE